MKAKEEIKRRTKAERSVPKQKSMKLITRAFNSPEALQSDR